jgi:hypothetical protein
VGAWGEGNLENDAAADWLVDLTESPKTRTVRRALKAATGEFGEMELTADVACEALAAAEVVATALGRPPDADEETVGELQALTRRLRRIEAQRHRARAAVAAVADPRQSELYHLWHEGDGNDGDAGKWDAVVADLARRLEA